tara:strand:+ start:1016 stop:1276 length:261 start_codon:yes stop_codon:yes gene_type:complete
MSKPNFRKKKSEAVKKIILRLLSESSEPISVREICYHVESTSNRRASVHTIGLILSPLVKEGRIQKVTTYSRGRQNNRSFAYVLLY